MAAGARIRAARPAVTGRALVLGALVIVLIVLLASPLHRYFGSRGDVSGAARQLQSDQAQLAQLTKQQAQLSDPGYIESQARARLQYAMPGDTVFVVVGKGSTPELGAAAGSTKSASQPPSSTWNTRLWGSVQAAGSAP